MYIAPIGSLDWTPGCEAGPITPWEPFYNILWDAYRYCLWTEETSGWVTVAHLQPLCSSPSVSTVTDDGATSLRRGVNEFHPFAPSNVGRPKKLEPSQVFFERPQPADSPANPIGVPARRRGD